MAAEPDIVRLAQTIGEPTRIRMLNLLNEGRALTAKELAYGSGVEPATGTAHLQKLLADTLVVARIQGRHKYFRLASPEVARCLEAMMLVAQPAKPNPCGQREPIQEARFCYDHLAGRLAIEVAAAFVQRKLLVANGNDFALTTKGEAWFLNLGLDVEWLRDSRRKFATQCLDWSERREHLGGALGAAFANELLNRGWIRRHHESRVVSVTKSGVNGLRSALGVQWK
jgi:DNA-binding transcriptional ArsR family regulator